MRNKPYRLVQSILSAGELSDRFVSAWEPLSQEGKSRGYGLCTSNDCNGPGSRKADARKGSEIARIHPQFSRYLCQCPNSPGRVSCFGRGVREKFVFFRREADHSAGRQRREQLQLLRSRPFSNCEKSPHASRGHRSGS